jgi:hypothetical protein
VTSRDTQTSFTAGEIDPLLAGRLDIRAAQDGCRRLTNVLVHAAGGVSRRPGTRIVAELAGARRLIPIDLPVGHAIVALGDGTLQVVENGAVAATLPAPWTTAMAGDVRWAHRGRNLMLAHPEVEPQELVAVAGGWALQPLRLLQVIGAAGHPILKKPFHRFAPADVTLKPTFGTSPPASPIAAGQTISLTASAPFFAALHLTTRLRLRGRQVTITNVVSPTLAVGRSDEPLIDGQPTTDWAEEAFSAVRGWPVALTLHQDRLVIGGSRDLHDRLWLSRSGSHLDFDTGTGLDDEAIAFALVGDRPHDVTALVAGRQLQVFTRAGEWVVKGFPLTPDNVQAELQTGVGSLLAPYVAPVAVDGATLFTGATGRELREFLFTDAEQAYQAADLAVLCRHLMIDPVDLTFDPPRRLLCITRGDGRLATVTLDRTSNVAAWSLQETAGSFTATASVEGTLYLAAELGGRVLLERLDEGLMLDHVIELTSPTPRTTWGGLDLLAGQHVVAMTGERILVEGPLASGTLTLPEAVTALRRALRPRHRALAGRDREPWRQQSRHALSARASDRAPRRDAARHRHGRASGGRSGGGTGRHRGPAARRSLAAPLGLAPRPRRAGLADRPGSSRALHGARRQPRHEGHRLMGALTSLATTGLNLAAAQRRESAQRDTLDRERELRERQLRLDAAEDQRQRAGALRRRLAEERARAGAAGVATSGGSIDAVLGGLARESRAQQAASDNLLRARLDALRETYDARSRRSLIDQQTRAVDAGARTLASLTGGRRSLLD